MAVMFKTQQGRTLRNDNLTANDITRAVSGLIDTEVVGYQIGDSDRKPIHASTRHIVEWWDA